MIQYILKSLSGKILLVLSLSVALVMAGVVYLNVSRQTEEMLKEMTTHSEELSSAIYAGIKYPMSVGDSGAVEKQLLDIKDKMKELEIYICDNRQIITFSTHEGAILAPLKSYVSDGTALAALTQALKSGEHPGQAFEGRDSMRRHVINIYPIPNQEECFHCHGSSKNVLGAIVLKHPTDRHYMAITHLRNANMIITIFGICSIILLVHALMSRLLIRPIKSLAGSIRKLPEKIARGSGLTIPDIRRTDEIGDLQNSFYQMAVDLDDNKRTIERSSKELAMANKELEAFAYSVSHDLRAPLRNIDGFSKILIDDYSKELGEKAKHYLMRVRKGTHRMSLLIDDMLTFSRIGRTDLKLKPIKCATIVKSILETLSREIQERNIIIEVDELPVINCDPVMIQSLFSNLLTNAIKFTVNAEHPRIDVGFDRKKQAIFVRDNGIGFDMQYHDRIFQVFQRLHLPEDYEGTGIGLAIVKRIAERHKGRVWAESKPGDGATFYVQLMLDREVRNDAAVY